MLITFKIWDFELVVIAVNTERSYYISVIVSDKLRLFF